MADKSTVLERFVDRVSGTILGGMVGKKELATAIEAAQDAVFMAQEGIVQMELAQEDIGWNTLGTDQNWQVTHEFVLRLVKLSRMMYLMNPLIKRAVTVQELYVWGSGYTIKANSESVQEVLDDFFRSPQNQDVIGDAFDIREREQRIDGNTFLVMFRNPYNGSARIRKIPLDQIHDIVTNPNDCSEVWFYRRCIYDDVGGTKYEYYPDICYTPKAQPSVYNTFPINWNEPVIHIKTGGLSEMKYGLPELWSAIPWATAYKKILENFATILAAYARLAMKVSGAQGKKGIAAAKSQLNTKITTGETVDKNPPTNTASWFLASGGMDVAPIKTANSTTGPDEARALRSMVASGSDTPEHFFGDSDIGNFATSTTLDRPTELKMVSRQDMWRKVILKISGKLIEWSTTARKGKLRGYGYTSQVVVDYFDRDLRTVIVTPASGDNLEVSVIFPSILSRDVIDRVRAVVMAATLNGSPAEGIIPDRAQLYGLLMAALDEEKVDVLVKKYYPEQVIQGFIDPKDKLANDTKTAQGRADLGKAALDQADAAKIAAENPPKPVAAGVKK